jgi:hypothetical protein
MQAMWNHIDLFIDIVKEKSDSQNEPKQMTHPLSRFLSAS